MPLSITPLHNALERFKEALAEFAADPSNTFVRDSVIQRFEFTYELSHKLLRKYMQVMSEEPNEIRELTFPDLIRTANQQNLLLGDWPAWDGYRKMRGKSSHAYDESLALEVLAGIPAFLAEAEHLAATLQDRLDAS